MGKIDPARVPRVSPWLALVMRGVFALLAQTLVAAGFRVRSRSNPWRAAAAWWMVHSSLADLACLAVLRWLVGKEGKSLGDLLDLDRSQVRHDLKRGVVDMVALAVGAGVSSALKGAR